MGKMWKTISLIAGITCVDVIVLSPGLLGLRITGGSALQTAGGAAFLTLSALVLIYGLYMLHAKEKTSSPLNTLDTVEDYIQALQKYQSIKALRADIRFAIEQTERLKKKKEKLADILSQRFDPNEISYGKFSSVISQVEALFYRNLKNILNKVSMFDESEYAQIKNGSTVLSSKLIREKKELYESYLTFLKHALNINEEILLDLDKLLIEINALNSFDMEDVDEMTCMKDIHDLISQTKYYK
ncbi:hypothetical protein [Bacillus testis]|uniref:hypothetical protein n=1 Tax=Bacillus testis TaxID=1622072 RepID=UPI00084115F6|nr:hypothetical protein [Bacillus testis]